MLAVDIFLLATVANAVNGRNALIPLKMFGLCLCHRTKNLLALEDFVHFHNLKKCVQCAFCGVLG